MNRIRIDPAYEGIHLVDVENGCERIYIPFFYIDVLVKKLNNVKKKVPKETEGSGYNE